MIYHMTLKSSNAKVGPIPVVTVSRDTCPPSCPFNRNGCYADSGPLALHWNHVTAGRRGGTLADLCDALDALPAAQLWRYAQAGDLPGVGDSIDADGLAQLVKANSNRPAIAYTHKPPTPTNISALQAARDGGFHVNLSADSFIEADSFASYGLSVVVVLDLEYGRKTRRGEWAETLAEYKDRTKDFPRRTPNGTKVAVCPATYLDTSCNECKLCASARNGDTIIGFPAHGTRQKLVSATLKGQ